MQYTNREGILMDVFFKCDQCNSRRFKRPSYFPETLTFLEGHFECGSCSTQYCYYDEAFTLVQSQLTLF